MNKAELMVGLKSFARRNVTTLETERVMTRLLHTLEVSLEGYSIVPDEPTGYMLAEGVDNFSLQQQFGKSLRDAYKAMINAAKGER